METIPAQHIPALELFKYSNCFVSSAAASALESAGSLSNGKCQAQAGAES